MGLPRYIADAGVRQLEVERRFAHLLLLLMLLPRVIYEDTLVDVTSALLVWTVLGIVFAKPRAYRIPRAIARPCRRGALAHGQSGQSIATGCHGGGGGLRVALLAYDHERRDEASAKARAAIRWL
jgi:hypothetical protein